MKKEDNDLASCLIILIECRGWCKPGMGVNLWGESPLYMNPVPSFDDGSESTSRRQGRHQVQCLFS